jgi:diamine N-acetyltransferase
MTQPVMTQQPTDIRLVTFADLELLHKICCEAYSQNFYNHWEPGGLEYYLKKSFGYDVLTAELNDKGIQYYVAFLGNEPVAFMKLNLLPNLTGQNMDTDIELDKIYILPQCKGMKIGKKLIDLAFDIAEKNGKEIIWLSVIDTNKGAISFYEKMGFQFHSGTRLDYPYFKEELKGTWRMYLKLAGKK